MQIARNIHVVNLPFSVPLSSGPVERSVNVVLVCADRIVLIDSGTAGAEGRIFEYLRSIGRKPEEIARLVLTHSHPDHIGAARAIVSTSGCRVAAHGAERGWIEDVALQGRERPVPGFAGLVAGSVAVADLLAEGDRLDVGNGMVLDVLHTPGHSPGSLSFWSPEKKLLISGDTVPVPGEMPIFDSFAASLASLQRLQGLDAEALISAWEQPLTGKAIRERLATSKEWLLQIGEAVARHGGCEPLELCAGVVADLGLPPYAVNPLVARSLLACEEGR